MKPTAVIITVLSGLCFLPACFPRDYFLVETPMSWDEAQNYCRRSYTDLVSIHNEEQLAKVEEVRAGRDVWIGLRADTDAWRWSLENPDYYAEGETDFRKWAPTEQDNLDYYEACGSMLSTGQWGDQPCTTKFTFFCYTNSTTAPSHFINVNLGMTWMEAQRYCRENYTDLASVRNQKDNEQLFKIVKMFYTWIGLHRDSWKWSDGSKHLFSHWASNAFSSVKGVCVSSHDGGWDNSGCQLTKSFICYRVYTEKKVVKVVLKKSDPSVDMEELKEGLLAKLQQRLEEHGLNGSVTLRWVKQPDGKTFKIKGVKEEEQEEEESCSAFTGPT